MMNSQLPLILASNSPRRQELLRSAGFEFEVFVNDFDESFPDKMPAKNVAEYLAVKKNEHYRTLKPQNLILTADTTVVFENEVLNKPTDKTEAYQMLSKLSGNTHEVICGVCISSPDKKIAFSDTTEVTFDLLTENEINYYIDQYHPFDKAGAYGIQEWIGLTRIKSIKGSFYNVMGLPTYQVYELLTKEFNS